jgi:hypothetical protein
MRMLVSELGHGLDLTSRTGHVTEARRLTNVPEMKGELQALTSFALLHYLFPLHSYPSVHE